MRHRWCSSLGSCPNTGAGPPTSKDLPTKGGLTIYLYLRCRYLKNKRAYLLHLPRFLQLLHASAASVHGATCADAAPGAGLPGGEVGQEGGSRAGDDDVLAWVLRAVEEAAW